MTLDNPELIHISFEESRVSIFETTLKKVGRGITVSSRHLKEMRKVIAKD
jgi:hypothetical protein